MIFTSKFKKYNLPFHGVRLPEVTISTEQRKKYELTENATNYDFLKKLACEGYETKVISGQIPAVQVQEYVNRCDYELKTINELGFVNYALLVWDTINFARSKNIPISRGRGSVCGSLLFYLIGVHGIDSIKEGLYFERFLSKARAKVKIVDDITYFEGSLVPDIDNDLSYYRRSEIVEYLQDKYPNKTSKLLTLTTFSGKILLKDVLKTYEECSEDQAQTASDLLTKKYGVVQEIDEALENNEKFKAWAENHKESIEICLKLSNLIRTKGQHPSAILISHD